MSDVPVLAPEAPRTGAAERVLPELLRQTFFDFQTVILSAFVLFLVSYGATHLWTYVPSLLALVYAAGLTMWSVVRGRRTNFVLAAVRYFVPMTTTLIALTVFLAEKHLIGLKAGDHLHHQFGAVRDVGWYYIWNLADGLPGLSLPDETLPVDFAGARAGMLLLAYKILVLVPVLYLVRRWWKAHDGFLSPAGPGDAGSRR